MTTQHYDVVEAGDRLIDQRGCLTYGAMSFVEQLGPEQQEVVKRHLGSCSACAQQQLLLKLGADLIRRSGPRVPVPMEARRAIRKAVSRQLQLKPYHPPPQQRRWSPYTWVLQSPAVAGALIAIVAATAGLLMARIFG
jgi:anti-sigma factor RsiW